MHGPTCIFWANLTPFLAQAVGRLLPSFLGVAPLAPKLLAVVAAGNRAAFGCGLQVRRRALSDKLSETRCVWR
jgi:hypothetical protein